MVALGSLFIRLMVGSIGKPAMSVKEKGSPWVINTSHVGFVGRLKRLRGGNVVGVLLPPHNSVLTYNILLKFC
jgi:hypothetical protein